MSQPNQQTGRTDESIPTERHLWRGRYSPKTMIGGWLFAALLPICVYVAFLAIPMIADNPFAWVAATLVVLGFWMLLVLFFVFRTFRVLYRLSDQRLTILRGIVFRSQRDVDLMDVEDVSIRQGPLQSMLDVGQLELQIADEQSSNIQLAGVSKVQTVATMIDESRQAKNQLRGRRRI